RQRPDRTMRAAAAAGSRARTGAGQISSHYLPPCRAWAGPRQFEEPSSSAGIRRDYCRVKGWPTKRAVVPQVGAAVAWLLDLPPASGIIPCQFTNRGKGDVADGDVRRSASGTELTSERVAGGILPRVLTSFDMVAIFVAIVLFVSNVP